MKNRIIMGSMHTGIEDGPKPAERLAAYFVKRVKGGVSMIIIGGISPHTRGGYGAKLTGPEVVAIHREVTQAVYAADPEVNICMQLLHSGPLAGVTSLP